MNLDEAAAIRNSLTFQLPKLGGDPLRFFFANPDVSSVSPLLYGLGRKRSHDRVFKCADAQAKISGRVGLQILSGLQSVATGTNRLMLALHCAKKSLGQY
jgi:hypothetical protein